MSESKKRRVEELAVRWFSEERGEGIPTTADGLACWRDKEILQFSGEVNDALSLLVAQRSFGSGAMAVAEALRRRLEAVIPTLSVEKRVSLLESTLPFYSVPQLRPVCAALLDSFKVLPAKAAQALEQVDVLSKPIVLKLCVVSDARFRATWQPLVERWRGRVVHRAESRLAASAQRRALDASLYAAFAELASAVPEKCVDACVADRESILLVDVLLLSSPKTKSKRIFLELRRLATALDAPLVAGTWSDQAIEKFRTTAAELASQDRDDDAHRARLLLLFSEPLAAQLALQDLSEELDSSVLKKKILPADSPRCRSLARLLSLLQKGGRRNDEIRKSMPDVAAALWRAKRKKLKKNAAKTTVGLLAALAGPSSSSVPQENQQQQSSPSADHPDDEDELTLSEHDIIAKKLAGHLGLP